MPNIMMRFSQFLSPHEEQMFILEVHVGKFRSCLIRVDFIYIRQLKSSSYGLNELKLYKMQI